MGVDQTKSKKCNWNKSILYILLGLLVSIVLFYFWASSSNLKSSEYASIFQFEYEDLEFETDSFRLMTYNMGYLSGMTNNRPIDTDRDFFDKNLDRMNALLEDLNVDVVCFQEIDFHSKRSYYVDQLDGIAESGSYPHASRVINWDKKYVPFPYWPISNHFGEVLSGQAILSNFPIDDNERIELARADYVFYYNAFYLDRLAQLNILSIGGRDVLVMNVHLEAWDAETREAQADQLIELYKKYENEYPIILVGDFNSTPPGAKDPYEVEKTIEKILAVDGLEMATESSAYFKDEFSYFTFNSVEPYIKIDYIFYDSRKLRVKNVRVVNEAMDISDHLPVIADILFID